MTHYFENMNIINWHEMFTLLICKLICDKDVILWDYYYIKYSKYILV